MKSQELYRRFFPKTMALKLRTKLIIVFPHKDMMLYDMKPKLEKAHRWFRTIISPKPYPRAFIRDLFPSPFEILYLPGEKEINFSLLMEFIKEQKAGKTASSDLEQKKVDQDSYQKYSLENKDREIESKNNSSTLEMVRQKYHLLSSDQKTLYRFIGFDQDIWDELMLYDIYGFIQALIFVGIDVVISRISIPNSIIETILFGLKTIYEKDPSPSQRHAPLLKALRQRKKYIEKHSSAVTFSNIVALFQEGFRSEWSDKKKIGFRQNLLRFHFEFFSYEPSVSNLDMISSQYVFILERIKDKNSVPILYENVPFYPEIELLNNLFYCGEDISSLKSDIFLSRYTTANEIRIREYVKFNYNKKKDAIDSITEQKKKEMKRELSSMKNKTLATEGYDTEKDY